MLSRLKYSLALFLIGISFIYGWRSSYIHYEVKQLKADYISSQQAIQQRDKVIAINSANTIDQSQKADLLHDQLDIVKSQYDAKSKELQDVKNRLNASNHVNIGLVRAMGATGSSIQSMSTDASIANEHAYYYESISASTVAEWTLGLKQDDDECHAIHNATIQLYDDEMIKINNIN